MSDINLLHTKRNLILLSLSVFTYGQEICNNGIDDNSNGLIELNDSVKQKTKKQ